jgi:hypothetical protein
MALAERAPREIKKSAHPYGVREGTTLWSGPSDPHFAERAPRGMTVTILGSPTRSRGVFYFNCRVESPPEMKGEQVWLSKSSKQPGWLY